jgi:hypothetical protein
MSQKGSPTHPAVPSINPYSSKYMVKKGSIKEVEWQALPIPIVPSGPHCVLHEGTRAGTSSPVYMLSFLDLEQERKISHTVFQ